VLGTNSRSFNVVFALAQQKLRDAFGMEMVELPSRAGLEQDAALEDGSQENRPTTGIKKRGKWQNIPLHPD